MRIAQVAPLAESVPPKLYGGTERVVANLTDELVRQGHDVTLFASGDSRTKATLEPVVPTGLRLAGCVDMTAPYVMLVEAVASRATDFDVIHFHVAPLQFPVMRRLTAPYLTTLHGRLDLPELQPLYREYADTPVVSISHAQRRPLRQANWIGNVHHGLPPETLTFRDEPGRYLAFLGRISPEKRVDRAIAIARGCGCPIRIAAKVDHVDAPYFESAIRPLLDDPLVECVGEIGDREKSEFLGNARALLFPVDWPEPFGLVMIEALGCGTPVVAFRCGSVPEVIEHDVTGFVVDTVEEAIDATRHIDRLNRRVCRETFERRFTVARMADQYVELYERIRGGQGSKAVAEGDRRMQDVVRLDDQFSIIADTERTAAPLRVLKHGDTFAVFDQQGDIVPSEAGEEGLYHDGTRFLSRFELLLARTRPLLLSSTISLDNATFAASLTNPDVLRDGRVVVPRGVIQVVRSRVLWKGTCIDRIRIANYALHAIELPITLTFDADFADLFEVRGTRRVRRGDRLPPECDSECVLRYRGLDGVERRTRIRSSERPRALELGLVTFSLGLEAMFDLSQVVDLNRLPELICGFPRVDDDHPTLYPVACAPQAWAAGAVYMLLEASLGLRIDAVRRRVSFSRAILPEPIDWLRITNLSVGDAAVDLRIERHPYDVGVTVLRREGAIEIVAVK